MMVVAMSHGELSRYDTLQRVERRELRIEDAAALLGLSRRQTIDNAQGAHRACTSARHHHACHVA